MSGPQHVPPRKLCQNPLFCFVLVTFPPCSLHHFLPNVFALTREQTRVSFSELIRPPRHTVIRLAQLSGKDPRTARSTVSSLLYTFPAQKREAFLLFFVVVGVFFWEGVDECGPSTTDSGGRGSEHGITRQAAHSSLCQLWKEWQVLAGDN